MLILHFVQEFRPSVELVLMPAMLVPIESGNPIVLDKPIVLVGRHADCDAVILDHPLPGA